MLYLAVKNFNFLAFNFLLRTKIEVENMKIFSKIMTEPENSTEIIENVNIKW